MNLVHQRWFYEISWIYSPQPRMSWDGFSRVLCVDWCGWLCWHTLQLYPWKTFKLQNQSVCEKSFGACPWVQGDFTCNNARAPCNQRDQAQILLGTACVTLVALIINSTHSPWRFKTAATSLKKIWRMPCEASASPWKTFKGKWMLRWKIAEKSWCGLRPYTSTLLTRHLIRFQNHRCLDRISSRWWWSWRHSGRLARRLFPACWRLWLHWLVHSEPEDVQIAREPRAQKRWAWTCYTLWLKEVFPLAGPLRHNFEAAYVALKDLEPHLEKALSVSLKAARATSRAIFWKWANCSVACWAKSLLLSCLFSALNVRLGLLLISWIVLPTQKDFSRLIASCVHVVFTLAPVEQHTAA